MSPIRATIDAAWDRVGDLLTDSDFYRYEHRLIYASIGGLINATKPADVITVYEQLQRSESTRLNSSHQI